MKSLTDLENMSQWKKDSSDPSDGDLLEKVVGRAEDVLCVLDRDGQIQYLNPYGLKALNASCHKENKIYLKSFLLEEDQAALLESIQSLNETNHNIKMATRIPSGEGSNRWIEWSFVFSSGQIFGIGRDVTLAKAKEMFLLDIEKVGKIGGWRIDFRTGRAWGTPGASRIYESNPSEVSTIPDSMRYFTPDDLARMKEAFRLVREEGRNLVMEHQPILPSGKKIWVKALGRPIYENGVVVAITGTVQDITAQKEEELEKQKQKSQVDHLVQNAPGMVYQFRLQPDGRMLFPYVSSKAFEIFEITPEDLRQNPSIMLEMVHIDDQQELNFLILESAQYQNPFEWSGRMVTKAGKLKWLKAKSIPAREADGSTLWDGLILDITTDRTKELELEQQMLAAQHQSRLASVGLLAAGVGHEINNPLTVVLGKIWSLEKELQKEVPLKAELKKNLERIKLATQRIQKIVDGLRIFTRLDRSEDQAAYLGATINQVLMLLDEIFSKENLKIQFENPQPDIRVNCSAGQLQQVMMNLISNARDATLGNESRELRIVIRNLAESALADSALADSKIVEVEIIDNGQGIPEQLRHRLFEPFFTTKDVGKGTGLGLSISRSLAQSWGGKLELKHSSSELGTCFLLKVPLSRPTPLNEELRKQANTRGAIRATTTIKSPLPSLPPESIKALKVLIVEDEEGVRELLRDICIESGAQVQDAGDGIEALNLLSDSDEPFDLIITDLKMPRMDGQVLIEQIKLKLGQNRPAIYVISGGVQADISEKASGADGFLVKPFEPNEIAKLLQKVASALTRPPQ